MKVLSNIANNLFSWLYQRSLTVDGFFSADHLKSASRNAALDVLLMGNETYVADQTQYKMHLATAKEYQEVC